jgi:hypothetical protein
MQKRYFAYIEENLALSTIAHSEYHYKKIQDHEIPDKVDVKIFIELA